MRGCPIVAILGALFLGGLVSILGLDRFVPRAVWFGWVRVTLVALLLAIGLNMGLSRDVVESIGRLGAKAAVFAVATAGCALAAGWLAAWAVARRGRGNEDRQCRNGAGDSPDGPVRAAGGARRADALVITGLAVGSVAMGVVLGVAASARAPWVRPHVEPALSWILALMLFAIGRDLASEWRAVERFLRAEGGSLVFRTLLGGVGALAGAWLAGIALAVPSGLALAVGSGFGWYSLAGVLVTHLAGPDAGALAFLANVFREALTVLVAPVLAGVLGPGRRWLAVLPGGATTLDTTLPIITAATDAPTGTFAFAHGLLLSAAVPFLVPLFLSSR